MLWILKQMENYENEIDFKKDYILDYGETLNVSIKNTILLIIFNKYKCKHFQKVKRGTFIRLDRLDDGCISEIYNIVFFNVNS